MLSQNMFSPKISAKTGRRLGLLAIAVAGSALVACQAPHRGERPAPGFRADAAPGYERVVDRGGADACFSARNVSNWRVVGRRTVNIGVGASQVYQLTLMGDCPDLDTRETMAFQSSNNTICNPIDATIIVGTPIGPRRCPVRDMRRMSEAEIQTLRPGERP